MYFAQTRWIKIEWFKCPKFSYVGFLAEFYFLDFDVFSASMTQNGVR